jgi:PAS domain S-box-containing protein
MTVVRKMSLGLAGGFLIVLVSGLASVHGIGRLLRQEESFRHTQATLVQLRFILAALTDEQTGARGFALTGREDLLEPYHSARARLPEALARLRDLTGREPEQRARLDELDRLVGERFAFADRLIEVRRSRGLDAAVELVTTGTGEALMARLRRFIVEMEDEEGRVLSEESGANRTAAHWAYGLTVAASLGTLLLVVLASALLKHAVTRPAERLLLGMERMSDGDLGVRLDERRQDELGRIARSFNHMVEQRRSVEEALRRASALLDSTFRASPLAIVGTDTSGSVDVWNAAAERVFGWKAQEVLGRPLPAVPDDQSQDFALIRQRVLENREAIDHLERVRLRKDGTSFEARISVAPRLTGGELSGMMAIIEDVTDQKRAEEALHRSESRFRDLFEQASDGIFVADLKGRYTDVNSAGCRMLGYAREELVGKTIVELLPPEDIPRLEASKELMLTPDRTDVDEWLLRRKDGTFVPVEVSAKILDDGRWQGFVRDISERRRAQEELRRSESALNRAQRVAHLGSWERDLVTGEVWRSAEVYAIYGISRVDEYAAPDSLATLLHPEDRERVMQAVSVAMKDGRAFSLEHRIIRPSGEERTLRLVGECTWHDGAPARMIGTLLDVTDLKRVEREREDLLRWLRQVLADSPVGLLLIHGAGGERVESNRMAQEMLGRPFDRIEHFEGMVTTPDGQPVRREDLPSARALRGERIGWAEYRLRSVKGRVVPVASGAAPVLDAEGRVQGAVVTLQDITSVKDLERLRAEWNSVVAHDLRQPLNVIALCAHLLAARADAPGLRRPIEQIASAARRMDRMIEDLLDLSRLDARQLELSFEPTDLCAVVRASVERIKLGTPEPRFEVRTSPEVSLVDGDADRIAQVMDNLLTNAVKYGREGSPVLVEVESRDDDVSVAVSNEGAGIPADELPLLFQRFHRTDEARRSGVKGIGLGLYITRELIEAHGGQITAESTPGATTTFRFTLPLRRASVAQVG